MVVWINQLITECFCWSRFAHFTSFLWCYIRFAEHSANGYSDPFLRLWRLWPRLYGLRWLPSGQKNTHAPCRPQFYFLTTWRKKEKPTEKLWKVKRVPSGSGTIKHRFSLNKLYLSVKLASCLFDNQQSLSPTLPKTLSRVGQISKRNNWR